MSTKNREYVEFLTQKFDENNFLIFINDLLNLDQIDIKRDTKENLPHQKQFSDSIDYYKFIANYNDGSNAIGVFIVKLNNRTTNNARSLQRSFVATLLNKYQLDAALVAFYQDNDNTWRLSFVKQELDFTEKGIKLTLTPAKRYSYLVGEGEAVHTAQEYLLDLLNIQDRKISLSDIESHFDVEKVTKKFFEQYKEKYLELKEFLDNNEDFNTEAEKFDFTSEEFAKKVMGQLVFLYFLQKKGWLGVELVPDQMTRLEYNTIKNNLDSSEDNILEEFYYLESDNYYLNKELLKFNANNNKIIALTNIFIPTNFNKPWGSGDKKFITTILNKCKMAHKNFFEDYLEPFFYTGLNSKRDNQYFSLFNCKIPFLNGGLFEPLNNYAWESANFNIPNEMFSSDEKDQNGILDVFDLYNFTIDEEEPLEKDIAVDPEMLGKIFENLLDIKDRHSTGSFYTPRDIVHYMCQESISNYLCNKFNLDYYDVIKFIKYGDVITQEDISNYYSDTSIKEIPSGIFDNIEAIDEALKNIKICDPAVGSGAFPLGILNEIVHIRDNISNYLLIKNNQDIDQNTIQDSRDIFNIKLQTIQNSIYAVDLENSAVDIAKLRLWLSLIVDYPNDKEPKPLPNLDFKIMQGNSLLDEFEGVPLFNAKVIKNSMRKNAAKVEVQQNLFGQVADIHIQQSLNFDEDKQTTVDLFDTLTSLQKQFFSTSEINLKKELKQKMERIQYGIIEEGLKNNSSRLNRFRELEKKHNHPWFIWQLEFYDVFKNNGGFDIVIANPPYIDSETMQLEMPEERKTYAKKFNFAKGNWDIYIVFFELAFNLLNKNGNMIFITPDKWVSKPFGDALRIELIKKFKSVSVAGRDVFESAKVDSIITHIQKNNTNLINIRNFKDDSDKNINKNILGYPYRLDLLFSKHLDLLTKIGNDKDTLSNIFNVNTESACATSDAYTLKEIMKNNISQDYDNYFKVVNTGTIVRFNNLYGKKEMTYIKDKYLYPGVEKSVFFNTFKNKYSTMVNCKKIILKGLNLLDGFIDEEGNIIPGKSTLVIKSNNTRKLKLILAFLQSKIAAFYINEVYSASSYNGGITFTKEMIDNLPIPKLTEEDENTIIEYVDKLINYDNFDLNYEKLNDYILNLYNITSMDKEIILDY